MDIKDDILFKIDMQLYDEFNDTIATMNDHIGDIYSLRDVEEMEQAEKEKERELLREAIRKLQKENEKCKKDYRILQAFYSKDYIRKDKISELINEKVQIGVYGTKVISYIEVKELEELLKGE